MQNITKLTHQTIVELSPRDCRGLLTYWHALYFVLGTDTLFQALIDMLCIQTTLLRQPTELANASVGS